MGMGMEMEIILEQDLPPARLRSAKCHRCKVQAVSLPLSRFPPSPRRVIPSTPAPQRTTRSTNLILRVASTVRWYAAGRGTCIWGPLVATAIFDPRASGSA